MTTYWCEQAWLTDGVAAGVRVLVDGGLVSDVTTDTAPAAGETTLTGLVLPGLANAHSHAFHRALRGRTHDGGGTFWTWRERMYSLAARLDPDSYLALARAVYVEMALAGVTCVGEFHYLHHAPGGARYDDPNAMGQALVEAAAQAGIRLTLLDTCYLAGGLDGDGHHGLDEAQARFSDGDAAAWAARRAALVTDDRVQVGAAVHSVRAVSADQLDVVVSAAHKQPLHVHVSEQQQEVDACRAFYGRTPVELLADHGVLGPRSTAVHATRVSAADVKLLGMSETAVCACPSTEADLADGIGPFRALSDAGSPLCLGSDQHATVDLLGEARLLECGERLAAGRRGRFSPVELVEALTAAGHAALGWPDAGRIAPGQRADLVGVALDTARTAGSDPAQAVLVAGADDVHTVVVDGAVVVSEGEHVSLGPAGPLLTEAIDPLWAES